jgi:hypothetical protein
MILTKQLQVVIESSLAQGRDYEDIRDILMKQGFQDADISELFSQYRGSNPEPKKEVEAVSEAVSTPTPSAPAIFTPVGFENKLPKKDFVPFGYPMPQKDMNSNTSAQDFLQGDVQKFMNVGTNTQTAKDILMKQDSGQTQTQSQTTRLPAPGTTMPPTEISQKSTTAETTPEVVQEEVIKTTKSQLSEFVSSLVPRKTEGQHYINVGFAGMPEMEKVLSEEQSKNLEKSPWPLVFVLLFVLSIFSGFFYWFFIVNKEAPASDILDQLIIPEPEAPAPPPVPTGPVDPFTNLPLEVK